MLFCQRTLCQVHHRKASVNGADSSAGIQWQSSYTGEKYGWGITSFLVTEPQEKKKTFLGWQVSRAKSHTRRSLR